MICARIVKPLLSEAFGDDGRTQCTVPDVGDLAGEQAPGRRPIRDLVVADLALSRRIVDAAAMTPFRIVFDAIGRVGDHQLRHGARQAATAPGWHPCCRRMQSDAARAARYRRAATPRPRRPRGFRPRPSGRLPPAKAPLANSLLVKPSVERSAPIPERSASSRLSISASQPAFSAIRLSASTKLPALEFRQTMENDDRRLGQSELSGRSSRAASRRSLSTVAEFGSAIWG